MYSSCFSKPFPKRQILDCSELKEFADDNFNFDGNVEKLSKRVGNTVEKGEIAHYEQFLLFPTVFSRLVLQTCKSKGFFGKGLNKYCGNLLERPQAGISNENNIYFSTEMTKN